MHFNFDFSAREILWTLTFAALLVLLVVLMGRDRVRRFPWFTASIALMGLLMLATQVLLDKMSRIMGTVTFLTMSDLDVVVTLLVLVELARHAFRGLSKKSWIIGTLAMLAVAATPVALWGPWPAWKTLSATSELATIRLMDLTVDKGTLFTGVLSIELGLLVTLFGRRFGAGWRSHTQRIVIGLSTASLAQTILRGTMEAIGKHTQIHSQAEYNRVMDLRDKLIHGNNVIFLCVMIWWIASLWVDEPGTAAAGEVPAQATPVAGAAALSETSHADAG